MDGYIYGWIYSDYLPPFMVHGILGERNKLEGCMTTRYEDNRLGCVIKYLKKIFDQGYDVIMTSSIGPFLNN